MPPYAQTVKSVLRPFYGPPRAAFQYVRAIKIARDYAANHRISKEVYRANGCPSDPAFAELSQVGVRTVIPGETSQLITPPPNFLERVRALAQNVDARFAESQHCMFLPPVDRTALPPRTADVPAVREHLVISLQLKAANSLPGLDVLCDELLPEVERRVFGSYVIVDKVYVYRNLVSSIPAQVSWLWHYDNHPTEVLKVMIYLTDVTERTAPLEYLRNARTKDALVFNARPLLGNSRVHPARIEQLVADGYETHKATGPIGTITLFDDNVLHRANFAEEGHRDVLVLQIRPAAFRPDRRLNPKWTGSFEHVDFNPRPSDYTLRTKTRRLSD